MDEKLYTVVDLRPSDILITESEGPFMDSIYVSSGSVRVFVAWVDAAGRRGRQKLIGRFPEGYSIPGFSLNDYDENGALIRWCFILKTSEGATLHILRGLGTKVAQRKFVQAVDTLALEQDGKSAGLQTIFENQQRDFSATMKDFYADESLKDAVIIFHGEKRSIRDQNDAEHVFGNIFRMEDIVVGDDPRYRAVAYACLKSGIPIREEPVAASCGDDLSPPNIAAAAQFACRSVVLDAGWYKKDSGVITGTLGEDPVACVPMGSGSYTLYNGRTEESCALTKELAEQIDPKAYVLCRTLPSRSLTKKDLLRFGIKSIRRSDVILVLILTLASTLIGILLPTLNQKIYDDYIPLGNEGQLIQICVVIASFMLGSLFLDMVKNLTDFRISSHIGYDLQNAVYYRIFQLPESFFRNFDSADLGQRLEYITIFAKKYTDTIVVSGLSSIFGLLYLYKMINYSGKLSAFAMLGLLAVALGTWFFSRITMKFDKQAEEKKGESSSKLYQFLNGIEKLRMAGAEDKAAYEYLVPFASQQNIELRRDRVNALEGALSAAVTTGFSMVFYYLIVKSNLKISTGAFMAFNSAFGTFSAAFMQTVKSMLDIYELRPLYERFRPIVETEPEDDGKGKIPGELKGAISVRGVYFSYDGTKNILNGIDIDIKPGEYVGIVGASGCGKSTLLKLLLGFETPNQGSITYDDMDLKTLDKRALRKKLGVVLQNGKLIAGNILENITITAPHATMKEVNRVVKAVGLKDDIDRMPMGIRTVLGENCGTISGGQQQRILIARAIIGNPSVLIFDEATSALDNHTQAEVCRSLEEMKITRIAVAHRLSTVRNCDKIIVMNQGVVEEIGDFDTLMARKGLFYELAIRQIS